MGGGVSALGHHMPSSQSLGDMGTKLSFKQSGKSGSGEKHTSGGSKESGSTKIRDGDDEDEGSMSLTEENELLLEASHLMEGDILRMFKFVDDHGYAMEEKEDVLKFLKDILGDDCLLPLCKRMLLSSSGTAVSNGHDWGSGGSEIDGRTVITGLWNFLSMDKIRTVAFLFTLYEAHRKGLDKKALTAFIEDVLGNDLPSLAEETQKNLRIFEAAMEPSPSSAGTTSEGTSPQDSGEQESHLHWAGFRSLLEGEESHLLERVFRSQDKLREHILGVDFWSTRQNVRAEVLGGAVIFNEELGQVTANGSSSRRANQTGFNSGGTSPGEWGVDSSWAAGRKSNTNRQSVAVVDNGNGGGIRRVSTVRLHEAQEERGGGGRGHYNRRGHKVDSSCSEEHGHQGWGRRRDSSSRRRKQSDSQEPKGRASDAKNESSSNICSRGSEAGHHGSRRRRASAIHSAGKGKRRSVASTAPRSSGVGALGREEADRSQRSSIQWSSRGEEGEGMPGGEEKEKAAVVRFEKEVEKDDKDQPWTEGRGVEVSSPTQSNASAMSLDTIEDSAERKQ